MAYNYKNHLVVKMCEQLSFWIDILLLLLQLANWLVYSAISFTKKIEKNIQKCYKYRKKKSSFL